MPWKAGIENIKLMEVHHPIIWRLTDVLKDEQQGDEQVISWFLVVTFKHNHQLHNDTNKTKFI